MIGHRQLDAEGQMFEEENGVVYATTQAAIGTLLGVNRRTVADWVTRGMPGRPGYYPTGDIVHWYAEMKTGRKICRECWRPL